MTEFSDTRQPSDEKRKGGRVKRQIMTEALMLALNEEVEEVADSGVKTKRLRIIANKLAEKAKDGDIHAIKEVFDRTEGKAAQAILLQGDEDNPIVSKVLVEIID